MHGILVLLLTSVPILTGCRDGDGDPLAVRWTDGASALAGELPDLPSLPELVAEATRRSAPGEVRDAADLEAAGSSAGLSAGARPSLDGAETWIGRWESTWIDEPTRGREARYAIYDEAAEPLARHLGSTPIEDALGRVQTAAEELRAWGRAGLPEPERDRLDEVAALVEWGRASLAERERAEALRAALEAADRLRAASPGSVAQLLISRARVLRQSNPSGFTPTDRERVDRLISGAERALEREEFEGAIRRAYYAARILGDPLP